MRLARDRLRAAHHPRLGGRQRAAVGPQHDVRVEHREQRLEVAVARGGEERVDDLALAREVGVGDRALALAPRRRARLASLRAACGVRSTIGAISSNGTANMSCSTNASRSAGGSVSSTTSSASPTESASSASCSGSTPSARSTIGSGTCTSSGSSRRDLARAQHVQADARDDGGEPAAEVLDLGSRRRG